MRIWNLIGRGEEGAERGVGVGAFVFYPLAVPFELPGAFAVVIVQNAAGDIGKSNLVPDVFGGFSDDHGELHLPVGLRGTERIPESVVRSREGGGGFKENGGLGGFGHAGSGDVVAIVHGLFI